MKQLSNSNIIILPTTDEPILGSILFRQAFDCISLWRYKEMHTYKSGITVFRTLGGSFEDWSGGFQKQHLYIVSDDEIKEGDWHLHFYANKGVLAQSFNGGVNVVNSRKDYKKIIATTDKLLNLPHPSEDLINKFVEDYNKEFKKNTFSIKLDKETTETKVYILPKHLYEDDENYSKMSDEDFKGVAELEGVVLTLKEFQDGFNKNYCRDFTQNLDCIRFINVKV